MSNTDTQERPHHPYSPSSLQSREFCPHYTGREGVTNAAAEAGTRQHAISETGEDDPHVDDEQYMAVTQCLTMYADVKAKFHTEDTPVSEYTEEYLPIDDEKITVKGKVWEGTSAGYFDRAFVTHDGKHCEAFDWKFGVWPVEPTKNNRQAEAYVLGLFRRFPTVETVTFNIGQPQVSPELDSFSWHRSSIPALLTRARAIVHRAIVAERDPTYAKAKPSTGICLFCGNIGRCPKVADAMLSLAKKYDPLSIPEDVSPEGLLTSENYAEVLRISQMPAVWAESIRSAITARVLRGDIPTPAGYRIQANTKRDIVDVEAFKQVALKYMTEQEYLGAYEPRFGKTEKIVASKAPRMEKGAAVEQFAADLVAAGAVQTSTGAVFLKAIPAKKSASE